MSPRDQRRAIELLKDAADVIYEEVYAAGADEVKENPQLGAHNRTHTKIARFLVRIGAVEPGHYGSLP